MAPSRSPSSCRQRSGSGPACPSWPRLAVVPLGFYFNIADESLYPTEGYFFFPGGSVLPPRRVIAASWPRRRLDFFCDCALEKGRGRGRTGSTWVEEMEMPGTRGLFGSAPSPALGCSTPADSPNPGLGSHPAPPQHLSGPECEAWPALLLGFEVLFLYDGRKCGQTKLFLKKALLLIFFFFFLICVFMTAKRRGFQGKGLV